MLSRVLVSCRGHGVVPESLEGGLADAWCLTPHDPLEAASTGSDDAVGIAAVLGDEGPAADGVEESLPKE